MKSKTRIFTSLMAAVILPFVTACAAISPSPTGTPSASDQTPSSAASSSSSENPTTVIDQDREGNPITLPETINKVISMGPSNTEILVALGCGNMIIAVDDYSNNVAGLKPDIPMFSMMTPDGEQIIDLDPDMLIVTGMSKAGGDDPFKIVTDAGICVIYIPSSSSIEGVKDDIRYIAEVVGEKETGDEIIADMEQEIDAIRAIGHTISEKKAVYFEISAAPYMYSFGSGMFLNEMIDLVGAVNIFADQEEWISVADEAVLSANPDVILTSVNYIDDPIDEIKSRDGWSEITAVQNDAVYYIDTDSSNRPSQNIIKALQEMAKAIYPDKY
ncbi:MAG: ABC transporter substrate-binding protein [Oscillospiraceae bacterium]|nr:ABC transporter substrate-binding protein [Oscillospiraceae bacterium]